ncbi:MAG: hypothetical protein EPN43_07225 [Jatrophihabitans sp.]|nr:MAG: hypothetical protein EPN43_07225 [Jatrophihabitans sp.]
MGRWAKAGIAATAASAVFALPAVATAAYVGTAAASLPVATDTLAAPGPLTVAVKCQGRTPTVTVSWTATPSTYATGYDVLLTKSGSTPTVTSVSGRTTTTATVTIGTGATYSITARADFLNWTSVQTASVPASCP